MYWPIVDSVQIIRRRLTECGPTLVVETHPQNMKGNWNGFQGIVV